VDDRNNHPEKKIFGGRTPAGSVNFSQGEVPSEKKEKNDMKLRAKGKKKKISAPLVKKLKNQPPGEEGGEKKVSSAPWALIWKREGTARAMMGGGSPGRILANSTQISKNEKEKKKGGVVWTYGGLGRLQGIS